MVGFKDAGGTGYKDSGVGYKSSMGDARPVAGYGAGVGFNDSQDIKKPSGFGLKAALGGGETKKADVPADVSRQAVEALKTERIAQEKRQADEIFKKRQQEQRQWEQKELEQKKLLEQKQYDQRMFEERQRQERLMQEKRADEERNRQK